MNVFGGQTFQCNFFDMVNVEEWTLYSNKLQVVSISNEDIKNKFLKIQNLDIEKY